MNWERVDNVRGRCDPDVMEVTLKPKYRCMTFKKCVRMHVNATHFNYHIDGERWAIEPCEDGLFKFNDAATLACGSLLRRLNLTEITTYSVKVDENGWLICTPIKTEDNES